MWHNLTEDGSSFTDVKEVPGVGVYLRTRGHKDEHWAVCWSPGVAFKGGKLVSIQKSDAGSFYDEALGR